MGKIYESSGITKDKLEAVNSILRQIEDELDVLDVGEVEFQRNNFDVTLTVRNEPVLIYSLAGRVSRTKGNVTASGELNEIGIC